MFHKIRFWTICFLLHKASSSEFDYFDEDAEVIDVDNFLPPVQSPEFTPEATSSTGAPRRTETKRRTFIKRNYPRTYRKYASDGSRVFFPGDRIESERSAPVEAIKYFACGGYAMKCLVRSNEEYPLRCKMVPATNIL